MFITIFVAINLQLYTLIILQTQALAKQKSAEGAFLTPSRSTGVTFMNF